MTADNWRSHPHATWAFRNIDSFLPHAVLAAAATTRTLPPGPALPALGLDRFMVETHADGLIVVAHGKLVFEHYAGDMTADARHLCFSVTKSLVGLCAELLIAKGAIAELARTGDVVPGLADSAFAGATLRGLLDMVDGVAFDETYADPQADIHDYSRCFWGDRPGGVAAALAAFSPRPGRPGFAYRTPATDVVGLMLEHATGRPLDDLVTSLIWQPAGAAAAAHWVRDTGGRPIASAGFACTLRDLARIGLWITEARYSAAIRSIAGGGDRTAFATGGQPTRPGYSYRSGWWIDHPAAAWNALGVFGQRLHIAPAGDLVIARFGSHPVASNAETDAVHAAMFAAIRAATWERAGQGRAVVKRAPAAAAPTAPAGRGSPMPRR